MRAHAYHTPLSTLFFIPPSTRGASLHGISEPHIGTVATSQFPRSRREVHWGATTVPLKSLMSRPYMSPPSLTWSSSACFRNLPQPICNSASPTYSSEVSPDDRLSGGTPYTRWENRQGKITARRRFHRSDTKPSPQANMTDVRNKVL